MGLLHFKFYTCGFVQFVQDISEARSLAHFMIIIFMIMKTRLTFKVCTLFIDCRIYNNTSKVGTALCKDKGRKESFHNCNFRSQPIRILNNAIEQRQTKLIK